jgi:hypothetical protein
MTHPDLGAVFAALAELARRYPHWRAGQVVANAAGWADADVWDVADADLLAAVRGHLANRTAQAETTAGPDQTLHLTAARCGGGRRAGSFSRERIARKPRRTAVPLNSPRRVATVGATPPP